MNAEDIYKDAGVSQFLGANWEQNAPKLHPICLISTRQNHPVNHLECMAGTTGLEPATSAVTGQRSNQLSYVPRLQVRKNPENQTVRSASPMGLEPSRMLADSGRIETRTGTVRSLCNILECIRNYHPPGVTDPQTICRILQ